MIKLLDCTLRDGGYINDWNFGYDAIIDIIKSLEKTNVDIIEVGFLKDEPYDKDRAVFNDMNQINEILCNKRKNINYAAMVEVFSPIPIESLPERSNKTVDTIRVIVWKTKHDSNNNELDALEDGYKFCKGVVERGYNLCIQPARVDQYTEQEFVDMVKKFTGLKPYAVYIVDSWGTRQVDEIIRYAHLADRNMDSKIALGYHGHNNMLQAYGNAASFIHCRFNRDLIVDGSVYGIGRCAGNLNIETFAKYLNDTEKKGYVLEPLYEIYEKYIKKIYKKQRWGYSIYYFLTAVYNAHPNYALYLGHQKGLDVLEFEKLISSVTPIDRVLYSREKADRYLSVMKGQC